MVNYLEIYYCQTPLLHGLTLVLFLGWLCFLFTWVGISASDYFSPNLTSLAKYFHIPDSLAGVTLLAFGNGAPDLFATFSAIRSGSGALALGELVGAAAFIACVVAGCMLILYPFQVSVVPFLREVIFFALTLSITTWIAWDRKVTLWEGVSLIVFYIIYVLVVMISTWMEKKYFTRRFLIDQARAEYVDWGQAQDLDLYNQLTNAGTTVGPPTPLPAEVVENDLFNRQRSATYDSDEADSASDTPAEMAPTIGPWVDAHLPLARVGHLARLLVISLRCVIIPAFIAYAFDHIFEWEAPWVIYVGLALGAVIGREPRIAQHPLAWVARSPSIRTLLPACVGFVSGISWVYLTADEVVALLQSLGIILNISEGILGLTVLALGNSLGDFMTNLTIARMGLPAMALSACFGGPMLNILLGIGISATTLTSTTQGNYPLPVSNTVFVSSLGTIFCMLVMLFWVPANNYRMTRGLGFILIFVYCLCMGINMVLEYNDENHHGH
ncbi:Sodium/calcium exchanger protein-domain-containing protein [Dimargaris cristalligena]|uniref:Sodium/calcium exchanger protein-domain-containing protein n=1 Tax=Dimargaris cristalligena TaxID=215637 RepID=A0A4Q0A2Z4_9FUNG|nr:Sodium/calcium exchanger protein-domain-containing protein [Dimargaris cristalligena]|eukprot:RKP39911.1 Sodium/calcium exchanger protein-domain-containing protein [Dimargaris cristalligena]